MINQTRFFTTEKANIPTNIANGTINANDLVITSDTHELYFVDENNNYFPITTTKEELGIDNVTNDAQIKGKASGTTENHVLTWGVDGYTVKDSGYTINKSVPANAVFTDTTYSEATNSASGLMSANDKSALDKLKEIDVDEVATQLQSLYVKLGGDNSETASSIDEWIDKIEDVAGSDSGSGSLGVLVLSIVDGPKGDKILNRSAKEIVDTFNNNTPIFVRLVEENPENLGEDSTAYHLLHINTIEKTAMDPHDILTSGFTDEIRITLMTTVNEYELSTSTNGTSYYPECFTDTPRLYVELH